MRSCMSTTLSRYLSVIVQLDGLLRNRDEHRSGEHGLACQTLRWLHGVCIAAPAQALPAVGKMGPHGCACGLGILVADGVVNAFVLGVDPLQVVQSALWRAVRRVHAGAWNDHGAQVG